MKIQKPHASGASRAEADGGRRRQEKINICRSSLTFVITVLKFRTTKEMRYHESEISNQGLFLIRRVK